MSRTIALSIRGGTFRQDLRQWKGRATPALQAAVSATQDIPILGTSVTEYGVALGIENFDGKTGINVSGTSDLAPLDQQAALFEELNIAK